MKLLTRILAFVAAAFAATVQAQNLSIATGGTGGVYYPLGGGMAAVLSKYLPNVQATARVTGGSVDNLKLIGSQQSEVALVMVDAALDALNGEDKFKGHAVDVRTLMVLYPNRMHVVSIEGKGIEKMADLKGKRVSAGSPGSATEVMAFRVIEAANLDKDKDMRRERLGAAESVNALKDGKIEVLARPLNDNSVVVGLFNRGEQASGASVSWASLDMAGKQVAARDVWKHAAVQTGGHNFSASVPAHGVVLLKVAELRK